MARNNLYDTIRHERDKARTASENVRYDTLTLLLGETERLLVKDRTDENIVKIIKKMISDNKETNKLLESRSDSGLMRVKLEYENELLDTLIPESLRTYPVTVKEQRDIIDNVLQEYLAANPDGYNKALGHIMKVLRSNYRHLEIDFEEALDYIKGLL